MPKPHNSAKLIRAACTAVDAAMKGDTPSNWHKQAESIVRALQGHMRTSKTALHIEREIVGCDTGWLGPLLQDFPWLTEGTGFEPHVGRPPIRKSTRRK